MYIYILSCMSVCMYVCLFVYMHDIQCYIYMCIYIYICVSESVYMSTHHIVLYTSVCCLGMCVYVCYIYACIIGIYIIIVKPSCPH